MQGANIDELVGRIPQWRGLSYTSRPLPGATSNRNFVVAVDRREFVVRIPGELTRLGLDRAHEAEAASRAAALGVGPPVLGEMPGLRTLVTEFVPGRQLDSDQIARRIDDVVGAVQRFHRSGALRGSFPIHRAVEWLARDASANGVIAPPAYERLHQLSRRIEAAFGKSPSEPVPSHNDLRPTNMLFSEAQVWLLDFEYAGMNDAFFDLADLSVNCEFSGALDDRMLTVYFGEISARSHARLQLMKVMSEFRDGMLTLVRAGVFAGAPDVDSARERFRDCEHRAAHPDVGKWLVDAARPATDRSA